MEWSLTGLPLPIVLRPPSPLSDDELIAFSRRNKPCRIEKNAQGELVVMTPVGKRGGKREEEVTFQLGLWTRQDGRGESDGPNVGWSLPDGSILSPDASWTSHTRIARFTAEEQERYLPLWSGVHCGGAVQKRQRFPAPGKHAYLDGEWRGTGMDD